MSKINILPAKVYNRIAAGEVVERPVSVVKELIENSIDAGATEIDIYIENGGKESIRVIDNGCGIERDDLQSAFLPHATSKISTAEDLDGVLTLGFRGEAIASIASVSYTSISSRVQGAKCYVLRSAGGELEQIEEVPGPYGTEVCVEGLFFNAPVRYKFLKTDKGEETEVTNLISRYILDNDQISFTYYADGKKILQSFGDGMEEALINVYGAATLRECFHIDATLNGIRVYGYIGNQNFYKGNKSYQSVFLNGRYIVNGTIASAIAGAYNDYLMKRQYPFYVLHIDVPRDVVDVNVHPNKADVRFADNQIIYGSVFKIISSVLDGNKKALEYVVQDDDADSSLTEAKKDVNVLPQKRRFIKRDADDGAKKLFGFSTFSYQEAQREIEDCASSFKIPQKIEDASMLPQKNEDASYEVKNNDLPFDVPPKEENVTRETTREYSLHDSHNATDILEFGDVRIQLLNAKGPNRSVVTSDSVEFFPVENRRKTPHPFGAEKLVKRYPKLHFKRNRLTVDELNRLKRLCFNIKGPGIFGTELYQNNAMYEANKRYIEERNKQYIEKNKKEKELQGYIDVYTCRYAGKLFNTYLLFEKDTDVFIIDQHAAHERLIFNRLKKEINTRKIYKQTMINPFEIETSAFEGEFLRERMDDICEMGFDIYEEKENLFKVTAIPLDLAKIKLNSFFNEIFGYINEYRKIELADLIKDKLAAAACKAAVKGGMDLTEDEIDELFQLMDGDMGLKCPHGRPVVIKMSKYELEKKFRRKV